MKKKFSILFFCSLIAQAQVSIEKSDSNSQVANSSVSIEFGNALGGVKGIVLPWVSSIATLNNPIPGTLVYDSSTQKIKYGVAANSGGNIVSSWVDLSDGALAPNPANLPDSLTENASAKVVIGGSYDADGNSTDSTNGILVLADSDKAMILPRVNSCQDIVNPSAGMMVYVTSNNQLAVYNGKEWSFWTE